MPKVNENGDCTIHSINQPINAMRPKQIDKKKKQLIWKGSMLDSLEEANS